MAHSLRRRASRFGLLFLLVVPIAADAQPDDASALSRLPWGDPDLQGIYLYQTSTPLERPEQFADKAFLTPEEETAFVAEQHLRNDGHPVSGDWGPVVGLTNGRTSQIVHPPDGRLPTRTFEGQDRADSIALARDRPAEGPEDRGRYERCIMGRSVPFLGFFFDQRMQIIQTPDYVVLKDELGELRFVPITDRAPLPTSIRQWGGQSRGHWDGDTLVIETTHFNGKWSLAGTGPNMRLVERFVPSAEGALDYQYTVHDPESFVSSWTAAFPFTPDPGPVYDWSCHEGNHSMPLILSAARAGERAAAASR